MRIETIALTLRERSTYRIPNTLESQKSSNRFFNDRGATPSSHPRNLISSSSENPGGG